MTGAEFSASILGLTVHTADIIARKFAAAVAALTAERDAAVKHRDRWRDNYMTVADAVAAESESAEHLADIARKARNDRDHYKQVFDESCEHVAEACDMLGFNRSDGPRDTWTLRESCGRVVRERDTARSERDAANRTREQQWKELQAARADAAAMRGMLENEPHICSSACEGIKPGSLCGDIETVLKPGAGCALLTEVARLREEVAISDKIMIEQARLLALFECPEHDRCVPHAIDEVQRLREENAALRQERDAQRDANERISDAKDALSEWYAATKSALGRAHAALQEIYDEWNDVSRDGSAISNSLTVLAGPEGRAAAEYVARLEKALREISALDCSFEKYERVPAVEIAREALGMVEQ